MKSRSLNFLQSKPSEGKGHDDDDETIEFRSFSFFVYPCGGFKCLLKGYICLKTLATFRIINTTDLLIQNITRIVSPLIHF